MPAVLRDIRWSSRRVIERVAGMLAGPFVRASIKAAIGVTTPEHKLERRHPAAPGFMFGW